MKNDFKKFKTKKCLEITKKFLEEKYSLKFRKKGEDYFTFCPFHKEKIPSFTLYYGSYNGNLPEVRLKCFGSCVLKKTNMDIFDFVRYKDNCSAQRAYEKVKNFFSQEISILDKAENIIKQPEETEEKENINLEDIKQIRALIAKAAEIYHKILLKDPTEEAQIARNYLIKRGVDEKLIKEFTIGYAPKLGSKIKGLLWEYREEFGKDYLIFKKSGLVRHLGGFLTKFINKNYYIQGPAAYYGDFLSGRIIFPLHDASGKIISLLGRKANNKKKGKYLMLPGTPKNKLLYGFWKTRNSLLGVNILIVEGPFDFLSCYKNWGKDYYKPPVVASLGTSLSLDQQRLIVSRLRYGQKKNIFIFYDSDAESRIKATVESLSKNEDFKKYNTRIWGVSCGESDPDEFFRKYGRNEAVMFTNFPEAPPNTLKLKTYSALRIDKSINDLDKKRFFKVDKDRLLKIIKKGKIKNKCTSQKFVEGIINFIKSEQTVKDSEVVRIPQIFIAPEYITQIKTAIILLLDLWIQQKEKKRRLAVLYDREAERLNISKRTLYKYRKVLQDVGFITIEKKGKKQLITVRYSRKHLRGEY